MNESVIQQDISAVDALWTIYQQQSEWVRKTFLDRVREADSKTDIPYLRTRDEMMETSRERMRDIIAGKEQTLSHDEAMKLINQAIAEAI